MDLALDALDILGAGVAFPVRERSFREFRRAVEAGLPAPAVERVLRRLPGGVRKTTRATMLHGQELPDILPLRESEQVGRLAYVLALAHRVWGSWDAASRFMERPHPELGGQSPAEATETEFGAREVESLLYKIQFGLPA